MARDNHYQLDVQISRRGRVRRRTFFRNVAAGAVATGLVSWTDLMCLGADALRRRQMSCIVLWMGGGPSQFETWDPKPGHANGGETKSISTALPGVQIAEHLPHTAQVMDQVCLIRSMTGREGSHPRASFLMHTGYLPTASVKYPTLGSHVAEQIGDPQSELPSFVRIGRVRSGGGGGFLGVDHDPFEISSAERPPDNTALTSDESRFERRLGLLGRLEAEYESTGGRQQVADHRKLYGKAARMVLSSRMNAFDLSQETDTIRAAYGDSAFAAGCLMARRLVEAGVTFIEVAAGNWDTHFDNFERVPELCQQVDRPYAQLLRDLQDRGLLERTLVLWVGEFGRTPRINARAGRDHYPRAFSAALAGAGVRGGQVIGRTDAGGVEVTDRPVTVPDLLRTVCHSLQVDADRENMSSIGRPIKVVDGGQLISEVTGS